MPQPDQGPLGETGLRNAGYDRGARFNWKGPILVGAALALIAAALFFKGPYNAAVEEKTPAETIKLIQNGEIVSTKDHPLQIEVSRQENLEYLIGRYQDPGANAVHRFRTAVAGHWKKNLFAALAKAGIEPVTKAGDEGVVSEVTRFLPIGIFIFIVVAFIVQSRRR